MTKEAWATYGYTKLKVQIKIRQNMTTLRGEWNETDVVYNNKLQ